MASSRIENLSATATSIALAEHLPRTARTRSNAEAISANVKTLSDAMQRDGTVTGSEIVEIQRILLQEHAPNLVGIREQQVWIGGSNYSPHGATHVAPHHDRVPAALTDWTEFARREDLGRLAHIAVAHAHFENIHPFADCNGRTGRVIVQRMLRTSQELEMSAPRARIGIEQLVDAGIVHTNSTSRRNRVWLVTDAVEAFMTALAGHAPADTQSADPTVTGT